MHEVAILRILDANANRAREALRVLEDIARFALEDSSLATRTKTMRHALGESLAILANVSMAAARDVAGDVGTAITGKLESKREGVRGIALAAGKRLTECLRSIEECLKALGEVRSASLVEHMRYEAYTIDAAFALRLGTSERRQWKLCLLLTQSLCVRPWREVLDGALAAGVDCIQLREKGLGASDLLKRACEVRERAQAVGASTIVNDDVGVALASGADGVHLGQEDLPVHAVRRCAPPSFIIGASTHSVLEAREAVDAGADYCGVGAMFSTSQKPLLAPAGEAYLQAFLAHFPDIAHLAIGGIDAPRAIELAKLGCRGFAVSSAICSADDPTRVAREILSALDPSRRLAAPEGSPSC